MANHFHFADRLNAAIKVKGSAICVGLDPRLSQIPDFIKSKHLAKEKDLFKAAAESILEFNKGIIDAVFDLVPIIKPQIAFYEEYGSEGIRAFEETISYARSKGLLILADIKRGDIGSTADAYAKAFLGKVEVFGKQEFSFNVDAITINAYLGWDSVKPFIEEAKKYGKGVFILVKTSNESSSDVQDLQMKDTKHVAKRSATSTSFAQGETTLTVYEIMAYYIESWGADDIGESGYSCIGAVVAATFPDQAKKLRKLMPQNIFLVPGYGAQGGTAADVHACFNEDGLGAIINSSRGIIFAWENTDEFGEKHYAQAARAAVLKMKEDLKF